MTTSAGRSMLGGRSRPVPIGAASPEEDTMPHEDDPPGLDPGVLGEPPTDEELAREEVARSEVSLADLVELDLDDPMTPSRRGPGSDPEPGSFEVELQPRTREGPDGG